LILLGASVKDAMEESHRFPVSTRHNIKEGKGEVAALSQDALTVSEVERLSLQGKSL
jgi:hypothetical protein